MLKWICHGAMALLLLTAGMLMFGFQLVKFTALNGVDDIAMVAITVKSIQVPPLGSSIVLLSEEYPTQFTILQLDARLAPGMSRLAPDSLHVGDRLQVGIKKEWAGNLTLLPVAQAYVVARTDGTTLLDDRATFGTLFRMDPPVLWQAQRLILEIGAVPALYFLAVAAWYLTRRGAAKRATGTR